MTTYFVSDLHINENSSKTLELFCLFLQKTLKAYDQLYILGDFFNLWIGDDHDATYLRVLEQEFLNLKHKNISIYIMRGNRDFLIGEKLAKRLSATLLPDPYKINIKNKSIVLSHGDLLCTNDRLYTTYRKIVQSKFIRSIFLSLPYKLRNKLADYVRQKSKKRNHKLRTATIKDIYDVNQDEVKKLIDKFNATLLIHGHTHKQLTSSNRIVLGEWLPTKSSILKITNDAEIEFL